MFELPSAKRVKRSELFNNADSGDEDHTRNTTHEAESIKTPTPTLNYSFEYKFVSQKGPEPSQAQAQSATEEAEAFAFNLFKPTTKPTNAAAGPETRKEGLEPQANLISIRSPSPPATGDSAGGFSRVRPDSDYFTSALPEAVQRKLQENYAASAISASKILALSRLPWPGASTSWRVISLPAHRRQIVVHRATADVLRDRSSTSQAKNRGGGDVDANPSESATVRRRPRPSKKRRLLLTARSRHRQMLIGEAKTKEAHEREKKNQKNRERKMKRRAKERREKVERAMAVEPGVDVQT